jgi:YidC/Oxa1 family membrane protein insertase
LNIWELIVKFLVNVMIVVSHGLGNNYGLSIIALTIVINLAMLPMTLSQIRSAKAMQDLQPRLLDIQKKYGRDKQKLAQEQMKLYKESGVKPAGCAVSLLIQMPVWIALYQSIMLALAAAPEGLLSLSRYLYNWHVVFSVIPLNRHFLLMDLATPNPILAILVGVTMWIQQKMTTVPSPDPRQNQQAQLMLWMMPMMFTFFALSFPSGLALYWVVNSIVRIVIQWRLTGVGGLRRQPKPVEGEKKALKFVPTGEKKMEDKTGADISIKDNQAAQDFLLRPSRPTYQPGRDRSQHKKKK